jgi:hypothetical protein
MIFKRLLDRLINFLVSEANEGDINALSRLCVSTPPAPPFTRGGKEDVARNKNARLATASTPQETQHFHHPSLAPQDIVATRTARNISSA